METFADRMVIVTGAGSGIGRELARQLATEGARVGALDRDSAGLDTLSAELKGKPLATAVADVTDLSAVRAALAHLESQLGPTDLLIANAGVGMETSAYAFRGEDFAAQVQVNLIGVANCIDAVLPGMLVRRTGHLAAISSLASYRGLPRMAGYCASKSGLNALFDALRVELRPTGIAVSTLCPGWIRTGLTATVPVRANMMEAPDAVRIILAALRLRKPFHAFPASGKWILRLLRHTPRPFSDWLTWRYVRSRAKR